MALKESLWPGVFWSLSLCLNTVTMVTSLGCSALSEGAYPFKYASWVTNKGIHWTSTNLIFSWKTSLKRHFLPLPINLPGLHSAQPTHLYSDLQFTSTHITSTPEESFSVTWASSTPTKQKQSEDLGFKEASSGRVAGSGPIAGLGQRNKGGRSGKPTSVTFSSPEGRIHNGSQPWQAWHPPPTPTTETLLSLFQAVLSWLMFYIIPSPCHSESSSQLWGISPPCLQKSLP